MALITNGTTTGLIASDLWEKIARFQAPIPGIGDPHIEDAAAWLWQHPGEPYPATMPPEAAGILDAIGAKIDLNPAHAVIWEFRITLLDGTSRLTFASAFGDDTPWREVAPREVAMAGEFLRLAYDLVAWGEPIYEDDYGRTNCALCCSVGPKPRQFDDAYGHEATCPYVRARALVARTLFPSGGEVFVAVHPGEDADAVREVWPEATLVNVASGLRR